MLATQWRLMLPIGLMNRRLYCLRPNRLGKDLIGLRCCQSNGTEPAGYEHTSVVSATVSAKKK